MKKICFVFIASCILILVAGCSKGTLNNAAPVSATNTQLTENAQPTDAAATHEAPETNSTNATEESAGTFQVNYDAYPEIRAKVTKNDTEWGHIERTTLSWYDDIDIYYEMPVFRETSPALAKINKSMQERKAFFFSKGQMESALEYEKTRKEQYPDETEKYLNTYEFGSIQITEDYISFTQLRTWFMGGTISGDPIPYAFDTKSGDPIQLTDLYKKPQEEIQKLVVQSVKDFTSKADSSSVDMIDWYILAQIKDYNFYILDGVPHVVFMKYEIAPGAAGAFDIPLPKPDKN